MSTHDSSGQVDPELRRYSEAPERYFDLASELAAREVDGDADVAGAADRAALRRRVIAQGRVADSLVEELDERADTVAVEDLRPRATVS